MTTIARPASRVSRPDSMRGKLVAWHNTSAGQSIVRQVLPRSFGLPAAGPDKTTSEGAFDQPYEWPNARIGHEIVDCPCRSASGARSAIPTRRSSPKASSTRRGGGGQDPVAFRAACWPASAPSGGVEAGGGIVRLGHAAGGGARRRETARGVALHQSFGSIVAQVAEVSLAPARRSACIACLRDRLRIAGQSEPDAPADGKRDRLRPVGRAARRDHHRQRPGAAEQLSRLSGAAHGRMPGIETDIMPGGPIRKA